MKEYLGEEAIKVIVAPGRAGYLIPEGDREAFERAVSIASSRWTGMTEPILSVKSDGTLTPANMQIAEQLDLIALLDLDGTHNLTTTGLRGLALPVVDERHFDRAVELRALPWYVGAEAGTNTVSARPNAPLWEKVAAGIDPNATHQGAAATEDNAGRAALAQRTMLEVGLAGFAESETVNAFAGPILLWITEPESLDDCQTFWNYRALHCLRWPASPTYLLPQRAFKDWLGLEETLRQLIRARQFAGAPDVVLNSFSVDDATLNDIGEKLGMAALGSDELSFPSIASFVASEPRSEFVYTTDIDAREWLLHDRTLGYDEWFRVQVFRQGTAVPVLPEPLKPIVIQHAGIPLRLRLSGGFLQDLPRTPSTARGVLDTAVWSGPHLQSIVGISSNGRLTVNAPSQELTLQLVVNDVPGQTSLSDKGRLAASLRKRHDVGALSDLPSLSAVQALTTRRSKELAKHLAQLPNPLPADVLNLVEGLGGRVERSYRSVGSLQARGLPTSEAAEVLERLADASWVERGFKVVCPACGISSFIPAVSTPTPASCPHCSTAAPLTRTEAGVEIYYRLDAFADRCSDQGVIVAAAVGELLLERHPFSALHLGTDIQWAEGTKNEVDILGFLGPQLVAGEIKTSATEFSDEQIDRDIALTSRVGAQPHILAYLWPVQYEAFLDRTRERCLDAGLGLLVVRPDSHGQLSVHPWA